MNRIMIWVTAVFLILSPRPSIQGSILDQIPPDDQQVLEEFFRFLILDSEIGYTLCGHKPVSIDWFLSPYLDSDIHFSYLGFSDDSYIIAKRGWKVWEKYRSLIPERNFIFLSYPVGETRQAIALVNKKEALAVIKDNKDLFLTLVPGESDEEKILTQLINPEHTPILIESNNAILGVMLGFGRNNSLAFEKRTFLAQALLKDRQTPPPFIPHQWNKLPPEDQSFFTGWFAIREDKVFLPQGKQVDFSQLSQEWKTLKSKLASFLRDEDQPTFFDFVKNVGFIVYDVEDNQEEIRLLREKYRQDKKRIVETFRDKPFLPTVLDLLTQEKSDIH